MRTVLLTCLLLLLPTAWALAQPPAARPDVPVAPSKGTAVAGKLPAGTGLLATYHAGPPRGPAVLGRVEPTINVTWRGAAPAPGVPGQGFSVRWTGYVRAPETGLYVLHTEWDDATDVRFADENVLSMDKNESAFFGAGNGAVPLDVVQHYTAGQFYRLDVAYKNVRGVSRAVLSWARPATMGNPTRLEQTFKAAKKQPLTVIPTQFLYPVLPVPVPTGAARPAAKPTARPAAKPIRPVAATPRPERPRPPGRGRAAGAGGAAAPVVPSATSAVPATPVLPDLARLRPGTAVTLPNLYFTQSTADLLPPSRPTLAALAATLRQHPALRLEIAGHTDNVGDAARNLRLSAQRARVVRRYLVQQGIDSLRLTARGYGGTRPVADNRDPQQRPRNRRVEAVVR